MSKKQRTLSEVLDEQLKWEHDKDRIEEELRKVKTIIEALSQEATMLMDEAGLKNASTPTATAKLVELKHYRIVDWRKFTAWVKKTNRFEVFQARVVKSELEDGPTPPGLELFTNRYVNVRSR